MKKSNLLLFAALVSLLGGCGSTKTSSTQKVSSSVASSTSLSQSSSATSSSSSVFSSSSSSTSSSSSSTSSSSSASYASISEVIEILTGDVMFEGGYVANDVPTSVTTYFVENGFYGLDLSENSSYELYAVKESNGIYAHYLTKDNTIEKALLTDDLSEWEEVSNPFYGLTSSDLTKVDDFTYGLSSEYWEEVIVKITRWGDEVKSINIILGETPKLIIDSVSQYDGDIHYEFTFEATDGLPELLCPTNPEASNLAAAVSVIGNNYTLTTTNKEEGSEDVVSTIYRTDEVLFNSYDGEWDDPHGYFYTENKVKTFDVVDNKATNFRTIDDFTKEDMEFTFDFSWDLFKYNEETGKYETRNSKCAKLVGPYFGYDYDTKSENEYATKIEVKLQGNELESYTVHTNIYNYYIFETTYVFSDIGTTTQPFDVSSLDEVRETPASAIEGSYVCEEFYIPKFYGSFKTTLEVSSQKAILNVEKVTDQSLNNVVFTYSDFEEDPSGTVFVFTNETYGDLYLLEYEGMLYAEYEYNEIYADSGEFIKKLVPDPLVGTYRGTLDTGTVDGSKELEIVITNFGITFNGNPATVMQYSSDRYGGQLVVNYNDTVFYISDANYTGNFAAIKVIDYDYEICAWALYRVEETISSDMSLVPSELYGKFSGTLLGGTINGLSSLEIIVTSEGITINGLNAYPQSYEADIRELVVKDENSVEYIISADATFNTLFFIDMSYTVYCFNVVRVNDNSSDTNATGIPAAAVGTYKGTLSSNQTFLGSNEIEVVITESSVAVNGVELTYVCFNDFEEIECTHGEKTITISTSDNWETIDFMVGFYEITGYGLAREGADNGGSNGGNTGEEVDDSLVTGDPSEIADLVGFYVCPDVYLYLDEFDTSISYNAFLTINSNGTLVVGIEPDIEGFSTTLYYSHTDEEGVSFFYDANGGEMTVQYYDGHLYVDYTPCGISNDSGEFILQS